MTGMFGAYKELGKTSDGGTIFFAPRLKCWCNACIQLRNDPVELAALIYLNRKFNGGRGRAA